MKKILNILLWVIFILIFLTSLSGVVSLYLDIKTTSEYMSNLALMLSIILTASFIGCLFYLFIKKYRKYTFIRISSSLLFLSTLTVFLLSLPSAISDYIYTNDPAFIEQQQIAPVYYDVGIHLSLLLFFTSVIFLISIIFFILSNHKDQKKVSKLRWVTFLIFFFIAIIFLEFMLFDYFDIYRPLLNGFIPSV